MTVISNTDAAEIITTLRGYGYPETDIEMVIHNLVKDYITLSDIADFVEAMEAGEDDEAFMAAASLGLA